MEEINNEFKGIELAVINPEHDNSNTSLLQGFANLLLGDRTGFTVIGPASVVKKIKQDPNKIELLTKQTKKKKSRKK